MAAATYVHYSYARVLLLTSVLCALSTTVTKFLSAILRHTAATHPSTNRPPLLSGSRPSSTCSDASDCRPFAIFSNASRTWFAVRCEQ
eukprot:3039-Heterococcus_DN1.PRE.3